MAELTPQKPKTHTVEYALSYTKNMGNFESLKVHLGISQEGTGHPDATLAKCREWVEENLGTAMVEVLEALKDN